MALKSIFYVLMVCLFLEMYHNSDICNLVADIIFHLYGGYCAAVSLLCSICLLSASFLSPFRLRISPVFPLKNTDSVLSLVEDR